MKKSYNRTDRTTRFLLLIIVFLILLIAIMLMFVRCRNIPTGIDNPKHQLNTQIVKPESIAIPGYEGLELIADTKKQTLSLPNPEQNAC